MWAGDVLTMKFCPKCGNIMVPVERKKTKVVLKCKACGYTLSVPLKEAKGYVMREPVSKKARVITTSKVSEPAKALRRAEEKEHEIDTYYEVVLDLMQEEEYSESE